MRIYAGVVAGRHLRSGRGERAAGQAAPLVEDGDLAVEVLVDLGARLRVAAALRPREELEPMRSEGDGVVIGDGDAVLEAEDRVGIEAGGPGAVGGLRLGGERSA